MSCAPTVVYMRISTLVGSLLLSPFLVFATGVVADAPAQAMSIRCMPLHGHDVYTTMCIVYHDDGSVEHFFVR